MMERLLDMPCMFRTMTGFYCPGCGGTRAVTYLFEGNLIMSFIYHPLILYMVIVGSYMCLYRVISMKSERIKYNYNWEKYAIVVGVFIIIINCILKNYYLIVKGIEILQ